MGKTIDKALISIIADILLFVLFFTLSKSLWIAVACTLFSVGILFFASKLIHPKTPRDRLSKKDFVRYILLNGNAKLQEIVEFSLADKGALTSGEGNSVISIGNKKILLYYIYKFGTLSEEDVAKCYRLAVKSGASTIYALTYRTERKALAITEYIPQKFIIVGAGTLYKYLAKRSLLPAKSEFKKEKVRIANFLGAALDASNVKYYILGGLTTSLIALFTPFKAYYLAFAFVNLILAVLSLVFSEKNAGECDLFRP